MDTQHEKTLETMVVDWILAMRREVLASGTSALKHWRLIQDRMRAAARRTASPSEFIETTRRGLCLPSPSADSSVCSDALVQECRDPETGFRGAEFCAWIERRLSTLIAMARVRVEDAKAARATPDTTTP